MSKSHVSLEQKQCIVCGIVYDSGAVIFDRRLKESMESHTITGTGLCLEHQELYNKGYIALVEATSDSRIANIKSKDANRTGRICHLKREVADQIFNVPLPKNLPMAFVEPGFIEKLQAMTRLEEE